MKKYYESPQIELLKFIVEDILTASGDWEESEKGDWDFPLISQ